MRAPRLFALVLILTTTVNAAAWAQPPHSREQPRDDRSDRRAVRDVVGEVEHNYRGHVVDVQRSNGNEDMYRVRVLQEGGRVKTVRVPARREQDRSRDR